MRGRRSQRRRPRRRGAPPCQAGHRARAPRPASVTAVRGGPAQRGCSLCGGAPPSQAGHQVGGTPAQAGCPPRGVPPRFPSGRRARAPRRTGLRATRGRAAQPGWPPDEGAPPHDAARHEGAPPQQRCPPLVGALPSQSGRRAQASRPATGLAVRGRPAQRGWPTCGPAPQPTGTEDVAAGVAVRRADGGHPLPALRAMCTLPTRQGQACLVGSRYSCPA